MEIAESETERGGGGRRGEKRGRRNGSMAEE